MDGMHDLGGKQGFGPVQHSAQAVVFHDEWEKRINALYGVAVRAGIFNMDQYRHAIERMEPTHYMSAGYYERTLTSLATLCVEKGLVSLHVRMPGYIRGKVGVVAHISPSYPFPDAHAHAVQADDEPTFDVRFKSSDLWANAADEAYVYVGVFQSYLIAR